MKQPFHNFHLTVAANEFDYYYLLHLMHFTNFSRQNLPLCDGKLQIGDSAMPFGCIFWSVKFLKW